MKNQFIELGSGTCVSSLYKPFDFRHPSGHLIQFNEYNILLDCGEGIRYRLNQIKFDYFDLDAIFISHFHVDHFNPTSLLQSFWVRSARSGRVKPLKIFAPRNCKKFLKDFIDRSTYNGFFETVLPKLLKLDITELGEKMKITLSKSIQAEYFQAKHGKMDAYAIKFSLGNISFTYSGDTGMCKGVENAAKNAEYFLCEANTNIGEEKTDSAAGEHLSAYQAGQIARKTQAKHLILTHYTGKNSEVEMKKAVLKSGYTEKISIAKDFQIFPL